MSAIQRNSLVEQTIAAMRERIAKGDWPVGDRIPTEAELVNQLGVGRNTVREATRALGHAGLLESRQGDGTYARAKSELAGALRRRVSSARMLEVLEVRRALEGEAASLAAQRRTPEDLAFLKSALEHRLACWQALDEQDFINADLALHHAVVAAAHNPILAELYNEITETLRATIELSTLDRDLQESEVATIHDQLIEAIRVGDPSAARAETEKHLARHIAAQQAKSRDLADSLA